MRKILLIFIFFLPFVFCGCEGNMNNVKMLAEVQAIGERLEVMVIESEYTFGEHWVILSEATTYYDIYNNEISKEDIVVGDTLKIYYGGQVMMSYPPQIVASKIIRQR